jgi:hypothetical protein
MDQFPSLCKIEKLQWLKIGLLKVFMKSSIKGECLQPIALNKHYDVMFKPKVLSCYWTNDIKVSNIPNGPITIILSGSPWYAY